MTRILITGGSGQVGHALQALDWPSGIELVAPSRDAMNLGSAESIRAAVDRHAPAAIINAGAYTAVDRAESDAMAAFAVNAMGAAALADASARAGIPIVHVSTDYVFDGSQRQPYDEGAAVSPLGVYGASKLSGELAVRTINPRHAIVRTAWVVSAVGHNFVKTMLRLAATRDIIYVVADQHGCPTSAGDLAAVLKLMVLRMLADDQAPAGLWHFTNAGATTWFDLASEIIAASKRLGSPGATIRPIATAEYPTPARRPQNSRLSTDRVTRDWGIMPRDWRTAVDEIVVGLVTRG